MKSLPLVRYPRVITTAFLTALAIGVSQAQVTVDGSRNAGEGYTQLAVQPYDSGFGSGANALANLHYKQSGKLLHLFLGGRANGNAFILFIDSKAGGVQSISRGLIASGGFENDINNLAPATGTGMTFEAGFTPDSAIRIYGGGSAAYVSRFNLQTGIRTDLGQADLTTASNGPVTAAKVLWTDASADHTGYAAVQDGVELALNLALLGVPEGEQSIKVMAMLVNSNSTFGSNHVLGPLEDGNNMGTGVSTINFGTDTTTQFLTIPVNRPALVGTDDEDGDGILNSSDPFPLDQTRNITFSVNMNVERMKGDFTPPSAVQVQFFSGEQTPLSTLTLLDPESDGIYSGVLSNAKGFSGSSFGTYKFITSDSQNTNSGYEFGSDRSFTLGAAGSTQALSTVYFSNITSISYADWSNAQTGGAAATLDSDHDGVKNAIEYFMGQSGNSFTPNPQLLNGTISWPHAPEATGVIFKILTSPDLSDWTDVTGSAVDAGGFISYTFPSGDPKSFVRLAVETP